MLFVTYVIILEYMHESHKLKIPQHHKGLFDRNGTVLKLLKSQKVLFTTYRMKCV